MCIYFFLLQKLFLRIFVLFELRSFPRVVLLLCWQQICFKMSSFSQRDAPWSASSVVHDHVVYLSAVKLFY